MRRAFPLALVLNIAALAPAALAGSITVTVDADKGRRPISPLIYGVNWGTAADMKAMGATFNRWGGNATTTYNWQQNAWNTAADWFFESYPQEGVAASAKADAFIAGTRQADAEAMITVPMIGWVAILGPGRAIRPSFSVAKYGPQQATDPWLPDAGNGLRPDGTQITGNDPNDAYRRDSAEAEVQWIGHLVARFGTAARGGVRYYGTDNEAGLWSSTHRDIRPVGVRAAEFRDLSIDYARKIKAADPGARIVGPEEWGWDGFRFSGYDHQRFPVLTDRTEVMGGMDYVPWLLKEWKAAGRPIDVLGLHYYPQGGEFSDDVSPEMQRLRNRSTRELWDPRYTSQSWIDDKVQLIPRMRDWLRHYYYADTPIGITEYSWGADGHINGATAQADLLGIFGREGVAIAARWEAPKRGTPAFKAFQMYRNYDGKGAAFGETAVLARSPDPDRLSAFAALRRRDGALTVMVVNKEPGEATSLTLKLAGLRGRGDVQRYQLTASNRIRKLAALRLDGSSLRAELPAQSVTLFIVPGR